MNNIQTGILSEETILARFLQFSAADMQHTKTCLTALADVVDGETIVIGLGHSLLQLIGGEVQGMRTMPASTGIGLDIPSTPTALWCWMRGNDCGELFHRSRQIEALLEPGFVLTDAIDSFQYDENRDMTGYEDGTENPAGDEAIAAAIVQNQGAGIDGSSFVVVQQWLHNFDLFDQMSTVEQDNAIGRRISDNKELDEAPESAHVKRTAQESFSPEAFMLRRSMPWAEGMDAGLYFVAFGKSFDAFEVQLKRMLGHDDGIMDALFQFTMPINGAYFWCPPMKDGRLDLSAFSV